MKDSDDLQPGNSLPPGLPPSAGNQTHGVTRNRLLGNEDNMPQETLTQPGSRESLQLGKRNLVAGLLAMALFMFLGFALVYLRDLGPNAQEWASQYGSGRHFETRLAHVHGTLFGFLNVLIGLLLYQIPIGRRWANGVSWLALGGLLMPVGILGEVLLGTSPLFVLIGASAMTFSMVLYGAGILKDWKA